MRLRSRVIPVLQLGRIHKSSIEAAAGTSWWHLQVERGQELLLSCKSGSIDTSLSIYGPNGRLLAQDKDSGTGHNSLLAIRVPRSGRYSIGVRADRGVGAYRLRVIKG